MSFDYINEAFKRLDALNEDVFDTSLTGLNNLSDFMDQDDASDIVKVIDPDAETEDAVSDSYIGKVIINCNVCHSHIFESKEDVVIDEDGVVNPEMQCPYCGEMSGFTVVGEIQPFEPTSETEPVEDADTEEPLEDPAEEITVEEPIEESLESSDPKTWPASKVLSYDEAMKLAKAYWNEGGDNFYETTDRRDWEYMNSEWGQYTVGKLKRSFRSYDSVRRDRMAEGLKQGARKFSRKSTVNKFLKESVSNTPDEIQTLRSFLASKGCTNTRTEEAVEYMWGVVDLLAAGGQELTPENLEQWYIDTQQNFPEDLEMLQEATMSSNNVNESIEELSLTANGTHIEVEEDDNGKVTLVSEPVDLDKDSADPVTIAPVSDETVDEIAANNDADLSDDDFLDAEDADGEEIEFDFDEVDEEGMDELGESYLKRIYENVQSFHTTGISTDDSRMIVEGVITFQSGVKKVTGFVFEAYSANNSGKVKFVGMNEHLSSDKRAFALTATVSNNKLLPESLSYNYRVGERHIAGTVNKK